MNVSISRQIPGLISGAGNIVNNILSGIFGTQKAVEEINNYVDTNLDLSNIARYLSQTVANSTVNISSSQNRGDIVIEGIVEGNINASQLSEIKTDIKSIIDNNNKVDISRNITAMFNNSIDNFQRKLTEDIGGILSGPSGQSQINNFIENVKNRFEYDFNTSNISNTMAIISNSQNMGDIRIGPSGYFKGNIDSSQKSAITSIVDTIQKSVSNQLLKDESVIDISKNIISKQEQENKGVKSIVDSALAPITGISNTVKWIIIAIVLLIIFIILFFILKR